jgi:hypothetical protein
MEMRKVAVAVGLIAGLLGGSLCLPAKAQWARWSDCNNFEYIYREGYCIYFDAPIVLTWSLERDFIRVSKNPIGGYLVIVTDSSDTQDSIKLWMELNAARDVENIEKGSLAVAENHRRGISRALDFIEDWGEPISGDSF